jgi:hypothetical protein
MMDDRMIFSGNGALPRGACSGVSVSVEGGLAKSWTAKSFF